MITHHLADTDVKYPGAMTLCGKAYNGDFAQNNIVWPVTNNLEIVHINDRACPICLERQPLALLEIAEL